MMTVQQQRGPEAGTMGDAAVGAVLGALAGDAAGAVLEFGGKPTADGVERALAFPGGGHWRVAPGQGTDDSELTLALLRGLAEGGGYVPDVVAGWYARWRRSHPFDVGRATAGGLQPAFDRAEGDHAGLHAAMTASAAQHNQLSMANGSLMRATPLGVWGHALPVEQLVETVRLDSSVTHPHRACGDAVAAYVIAIASLVRTPGDRTAAWDAAWGWASAHVCDEVRGWMEAAVRGERPPFYPQAGFVRVAFTEAFRLLRSGASWESGMREVLLEGGDTDTNACIVGGMLGAAGGAESVPFSARRAVLTWDPVAGQQRPRWLHPGDVVGVVLGLLDN